MKSSAGDQHVVKAPDGEENRTTLSGARFLVVLDLAMLRRLYAKALRSPRGQSTEASGALVVRVLRRSA